MAFNKFIFIVGVIWCGYYPFLILYDLLKSSNRPAEVTTHRVTFESKDPVLINDDSVLENHLGNNGETFYSHKEYLPKSDMNDLNTPDKTKSIMFDLGLETISGVAYEVSAENLSKYMKL